MEVTTKKETVKVNSVTLMVTGGTNVNFTYKTRKPTINRQGKRTTKLVTKHAYTNLENFSKEPLSNANMKFTDSISKY